MAAKDKLKFKLNVLTGEFDLVNEFNADRIVTCSHNMAGTKNLVWDAASQSFIEGGFEVVTTEDGDVITC